MGALQRPLGHDRLRCGPDPGDDGAGEEERAAVGHALTAGERKVEISRTRVRFSVAEEFFSSCAASVWDKKHRFVQLISVCRKWKLVF